MSFHRIAMLVVMAITVIFLRALPFLLFRKRKVSPLFVYLGKVLSAAAIAMLIIYSFFCVGHSGTGDGTTEIFRLGGASLVVTICHLLLKNPLVSIISGTVVYMILEQGRLF